MKYVLYGIRWLLVAVAMGIVLTPGPAYSQAAVSNVIITKVDSKKFPAVDINVRVLDERGEPILVISDSDLVLTENNGQLKFTRKTVRVGLQAALVLDIGAGITAPGGSGASRIDEMKAAANRFIDTMGQGDSLEILIVTAPAQITILKPLTTDKNALKNAISALGVNLSDTYSQGTDGIEKALEDLKNSTGNESARAILFFSSGIQSGGFSDQITRLTNNARDVGIPIHTVGMGGDTRLAEIASKARGQTVFYNSPASLDKLYAMLDAHRQQHVLTFVSTLGTTSQRTLVIRANSNAPTAPRDTKTYSVSPTPPTIEFVAPVAGQKFTRTQKVYEMPLDSVEPTGTTGPVQINWGSQTPRSVKTATLLVNGDAHGAVQEPGINGDLSFPWDLRPIKTPGTTNVQLQIKVEDELGFTTTTDPVLVSVELAVAPNDCTRFSGAQAFFCQYSGLIGSIPGLLALVISIPTLVIALVAYRFRGQIAEVVKTGVDKITNRVKKDTPPKAFLIHIEGIKNALDRYPIYGTTPIGRSTRYAELQFHQSEEKSAISGLHCTIVDEGGEFLIRDEGSTNGTFLNGQSIPSEDSVPLKDGDEIELARVFQGGIRLRFQIASSDGTMPSDTTTNRVRRAQTDPSEQQPPPRDIDDSALGADDDSPATRRVQRR